MIKIEYQYFTAMSGASVAMKLKITPSSMSMAVLCGQRILCNAKLEEILLEC